MLLDVSELSEGMGGGYQGEEILGNGGWGMRREGRGWQFGEGWDMGG